MVDDLWKNTSTSTTTDEFQYGYDQVNNVLYRNNTVNTSFGELYSYDGLNQLASFQRGTLNGARTGLVGSASRSQSFATDAVGNFTSVTTNGTAQTRSANAQNEITGISGATTPTYDANGNMTGDEAGRTFVYDAWNRLVAVKSGGTTLETFSYDGLGRRVTQTGGGTTTDLYYSANWQVVEEMQGGAATARYVWSPAYVDAMVLRDRATGSPGTLNERLWVQQDANWNVTALVNGSGVVVERYVYDPYGAVTIYSPDYSTVRSSSSYAWGHYHQGLRWDGTAGLYDNYGRWYSPSLARFTSADPLRFGGGDVNLYRAVDGNPLRYVDPSGLDFGDWLNRQRRRAGDAATFVGVTIVGVATGLVDTQIPGGLPVPQGAANDPTFAGGRIIGNAIGTAVGIGEIIVGGTLTVGGGVVTVGTGGAASPISVPATAVGVVVTVHGIYTTGNGLFALYNNITDFPGDGPGNGPAGGAPQGKPQLDPVIRKFKEEVKRGLEKRIAEIDAKLKLPKTHPQRAGRQNTDEELLKQRKEASDHLDRLNKELGCD